MTDDEYAKAEERRARHMKQLREALPAGVNAPAQPSPFGPMASMARNIGAGMQRAILPARQGLRMMREGLERAPPMREQVQSFMDDTMGPRGRSESWPPNMRDQLGSFVDDLSPPPPGSQYATSYGTIGEPSEDAVFAAERRGLFAPASPRQSRPPADLSDDELMEELREFQR